MVAKPRASRRLIAELAFILRALLDDYEAAGLKRIAGHRAALDLAASFVGGSEIAPAALADARAGVTAERARYGKSNAGVYWQFCGLPIDALLLMIERGDDESAHVLTYARQSVPNANWAAGTKRVAELHDAARVHVAGIDQAPLGAKIPTPGERVILINGFVAERGERVDRATVEAALDERGLHSAEPVLAFDEQFGGLMLPVSRLDHWREDKAFIQVGVWASLSSGVDVRGAADEGGVSDEDGAPLARGVPVARGVQDDTYFVDEGGRVWCHSLTDPPFEFGRLGEELVTRLALAALTYASQDREGTAVFPLANRVAEIAPAAGLKRLYADAISEWWSGADGALVVIRGQVWGLARTEAAAKLLSG